MVFTSGAMAISSSQPKSRSNAPRNGALASAISAAAASGGTARPPLGGGTGGGFGGFLSRLFTAGPAHAVEENPPSRDWDAHEFGARVTVPFERLKGAKRYKVSDVRFLDRGDEGARVTGPEDPLFEGSALRPGGVYTRSQLLGELAALSSSGMFERVGVEAVRPQPDGTLGLTVSYAEALWSPAKRFSCVNVGGLVPAQAADETEDDDMTLREKMALRRRQDQAYQRRLRSATKPCILPEPVRREVAEMVKKQGRVSARLLQRIRDHVLRWYHNEGFVCAQLVNFRNLDSGEVVGEVVEGEVAGVEYQFLDKLGNVIEGKTQLPVIDRELPQQLRPGHIFNIGAGKQALKNLNALALFSNIEVNPCPDETKEGGVLVEIKLHEQNPKSVDVTTEWNIVPGPGGRPTLESIQPGGSVSFEHRNICGLNRSLAGSVASSNLLNPQDDLSFKLEYTHPYLDGVEDRSRNRIFKTSCFNTRKLSPVFVAGPNMDDAPPVWVDRVGIKANITENLTKQSTFTYGLVMEEITTRDESNDVCTHGLRTTATGALGMDGPPTTFSGTGVDRMAFLQANLTRDNTELVNGAPIGDRCIFQVCMVLTAILPSFESPLSESAFFLSFANHQTMLNQVVNHSSDEKLLLLCAAAVGPGPGHWKQEPILQPPSANSDKVCEPKQAKEWCRQAASRRSCRP
uniref:Uncharacterized protein n=1 Tax=Avena sativa TaxID=4498 RepID=A0ACD6A1G8_AVESA